MNPSPSVGLFEEKAIRFGFDLVGSLVEIGHGLAFRRGRGIKLIRLFYAFNPIAQVGLRAPSETQTSRLADDQRQLRKNELSKVTTTTLPYFRPFLREK